MRSAENSSLKRFGKTLLLFSLLALTACSISTFGKFQYEKGVPSFIHAGETTRQEVFEKLGEPLVHRFVAGKETAIYTHEEGVFWFLGGSYEGHELVIRFENLIVSEVKVEKTGSGWGFLAPATSNNPGTMRSAR